MLLRVCVILLAGCVGAESASVTAGAPVIGKADSTDRADHGCQVVLRDLERNWTGLGWETVGDSWVWQGTLEISEQAHAAGLPARALYTIGDAGDEPGTWREVTATPVAVPGTPGFARYTVRLHEALPGPDWSSDELDAAKIQVVPFLIDEDGSRVFDHNRNVDDSANYLVESPDFAIWSAPTVCIPPAGPDHATLVFAADFSERREGVLSPGSDLTISYDPARLPNCRHWRNGNALWDIAAHVRFEPGGERSDVSVRDGAPTIAVPATARAAVLWFENTSASGCQAWDSNLGANYTFTAMVPPQWVGETQNRFTRDTSDVCAGGASASSGFLFDTWTRERAAITNLCFQIYEPGLTDRDDPDLWQKLDVSVRWRLAGEIAWQTRPVAFERRLGNNAQYRVSWRELDPLRSYHCPARAPQPTPDGMYEQLALEYYVVVNGGETRPVPGGAFAGQFIDYPDAWRDANCSW
ncbi:MAG: DUF6209 family protein [Kofleriaceae bacterium]